MHTNDSTGAQASNRLDPQKKEMALRGMTFALTGALPSGTLRDDFVMTLMQHGAAYKSTVTKDTTHPYSRRALRKV